MKKNVWRAVIEVGFIVFLFYANLLMGEFTRANGRGKTPGLAIKDIYTCAGNFRTGPVFISGTTHEPPDPDTVAEHVEGLCDYVNSNWTA